MNFKNTLDLKIEKINNALKSYIPCTDNYQKNIYDAMSYSLFAGGKRLRPVLMMSVCEMCGADENICMPFAAAIEMIHTYSLIHDDLPAMDNDDYRRGIPTNHIKFGEATAILAGDALLNRAFETVCTHGCGVSDTERWLRAMKVLAQSSGCEGMIGGQIVDIESEGEDIPLEKIEYIHARKTGAIIRSASVIGAILAGADESQIAAADEFAENLGIAFQIRDDILDIVGDESKLGKPVGSDAENNKNTYARLVGVEKAEEMVDEYSKKAVSALSVFGDRAEFLISLVEYLADRAV